MELPKLNNLVLFKDGNNIQYVCRETIEINPFPQSIPTANLEFKVYQVLSLTGTTVTHLCATVTHINYSFM